MRIIGLIISCLWFINIKAQTDKDMYFDINKYKDWGEISISLSSKYYFKNNILIRIAPLSKRECIEEKWEVYTKKGIPPKNNYSYPLVGNGEYIYAYSAYKEYKYYHKNGCLGIYLNKFYDFLIGKRMEYNDTGKLIKEDDYDKDYSFSTESLCKLIQQEYNFDLKIQEIKPPFLRSIVTRDYLEEFGRYCYKVVFEMPTSSLPEYYSRRIIYIDGSMGEIFCEEDSNIIYEERMPKSKSSFPSKEEYLKKIKNKSPETTHTFQGKTYTEEEWKAFEQEQWEKYQANKNHKSFWDKLFG